MNKKMYTPSTSKVIKLVVFSIALIVFSSHHVTSRKQPNINNKINKVKSLKNMDCTDKKLVKEIKKTIEEQKKIEELQNAERSYIIFSVSALILLGVITIFIFYLS